MHYYNRNLFEFLNDEEEEEEEGEIVEEVIMTMWGPAIGKLNWAEEMEREENKKLKSYFRFEISTNTYNAVLADPLAKCSRP